MGRQVGLFVGGLERARIRRKKGSAITLVDTSPSSRSSFEKYEATCHTKGSDGTTKSTRWASSCRHEGQGQREGEVWERRGTEGGRGVVETPGRAKQGHVRTDTHVTYLRLRYLQSDALQAVHVGGRGVDVLQGCRVATKPRVQQDGEKKGT